MEAAVARWLVGPEGAEALAAAEVHPDPMSLAAASALRAQWSPAQAAAALEQAALRRRAQPKLGAPALAFFWTPTGLEQATRRVVAERRARLFVARGACEVVDLTAGCGVDAAAFVAAGLAVTAVELDEVTAIFAAANLALVSGPGAGAAPAASVRCGDATELAPQLLPGRAAFLDPARRTAAGRTWRVEDFTPPWSLVTDVLDGSRVACAKLGPGLPYDLIPDACEVEWVGDAGTVVEAALWAGPGAVAGRRRAVVDGQELVADTRPEEVPAGAVGEYLLEPDGAVLRSGLTALLAEEAGAVRVHDGIGYLTGPRPLDGPFARSYRVLEALPYKEKVLKAWVRDHRVGTLEIKKRGVDADPAALRKRLKPSGPNAATLVLTPTIEGTLALIVERVRSA